MNLLAIESADGSASIALQFSGQQILQHNQQMRDSLSWFMQQMEALRSSHFGDLRALDALACCTGPGGFTGVRVAVGYVQGLGLSSGLPCLGVNSLDAMACGQAAGLAQHGKPVWLALDARMNELYLAPYEIKDAGLQRCGELQLLGVTQARDLIEADALLAGPGFEAWPGEFGAQTVTGVQLDARGVLVAAEQVGLARSLPAAQLEPIYLRNQVAQTLVQRGLA